MRTTYRDSHEGWNHGAKTSDAFTREPHRDPDRMSGAALPPRKRKMAMAIAEDASDDADVKPASPGDEEPQVKKKPTRQGYRIGRKKATPDSPSAAETPEAPSASPSGARFKEEPAEQETEASPGEAGHTWQAPPPPPFGGFQGGGGPPPPPSGGPPPPPSAQANARAAAQAAAARLASRLAPLSDLPSPAARPNSKFGSVGTVQPVQSAAAAAPMHGRLPGEAAFAGGMMTGGMSGGPSPQGVEIDPSRFKRQLCRSMLKVVLPPWQCPRSAPAPPQGAPDSSGWLGAPRREAGPLGAPPLPRLCLGTQSA